MLAGGDGTRLEEEGKVIIKSRLAEQHEARTVDERY